MILIDSLNRRITSLIRLNMHINIIITKMDAIVNTIDT
jgi:hypothetical protein